MSAAQSRRILVVAVNYAPEPGGTAPYTTDAAEHLASLGHDVEVITGMPHYPAWRVADAYVGRWRAVEERNGVRLRRLRHYVPGSQSTLKRALYEASFALHALTTSRMRDPNVVLSVIPGLSGAAVATCFARRSGVPHVVWLQDSVSRGASQSGIAGGHAVARLLESVETRILRSATRVIVISDAFERQVHQVGVPANRIRQIRNWTHISPPTIGRTDMRRRMGWSDDELIALHAGNMGLKQGLENVVDAGRIAQERGSSVRFVLMGDGNQRAALQERARDLRTVRFLPPVPHEQYSSVLAAADVLLVNERPGLLDMSLPSKLTSYAIAGRPVLAAVDSRGATAHEVSSGHLGTVIDSNSPGLLLRAVQSCATQTATIGRTCENGGVVRSGRSRPTMLVTAVLGQ